MKSFLEKKKMKLGTTPKTFSLLSIGQRGVGKTVFLAGSYTELHADSQPDDSQQLWFDCQDDLAQENLEKLLSYIALTGQYPPGTIKSTDFKFSLKRRSRWGSQTVCHFRWWDIPGESCNVHDLGFNEIVATSHGCCVFVDAHALVHKQAYLQALKQIMTQVAAIASLVSLNHLKYAFAVILTKCDLLEPTPLSTQRLQQGLQPLISRLEAAKANYQMFYSFIPVVQTANGAILNAKGAAAPLVWLVLELSQLHNPAGSNNPLKSVTQVLPGGRFQIQQQQAPGGLRSLLRRSHKSLGNNSLGRSLLSTTQRNLLLLALAIVGFVGALGYLAIDYNWFPQNTQNLQTLERHRQLERAIFLTEKLVQQQPKLIDLHLQLAQLYELTGQANKAESVYDQVLTQQQYNFEALIGKALLRHAQGDNKTAGALFAQAEQAAPPEHKAQIRALAQQTLQPPAQPLPPGK